MKPKNHLKCEFLKTVQQSKVEPSRNHSEESKQRTCRAQYPGTTENSHIGHCTNTAGCANVEVQNSITIATEQLQLYIPSR